MENTSVKVPEFEEIEVVDEAEETSEGSNMGSLFAGIVGGFLAYAMIGGAKKLKAIIIEKRAQKNKEAIVAEDGQIVESGEVSQPEA